MPCPEPVLKTKKALEEMGEDGVLDIVLNSAASVENVKRLAANSGHEFREEKGRNGEVVISIIKGYACSIAEKKGSNIINKTVFIKDDKLGDGELGSMLIAGLLKNMLEFDELPKNIVFVNRGIFLTTQSEEADIVNTLKEFAKRGTEIYSCGMCFEYYGIDMSELKVGEIGNAYDTAGMLLNTEVISL